jgi:ABC-type multidrug transport system ATPase subunit
MSDHAVSIERLSKHFGPTRALDEVSFKIPRKGVFGLLGPNGAGKTTLFSVAAGFLKPTSGHIEVLDVDVERISELRGRLSILPQDAAFQANVPVLEQISFFSQLSGRTKQEAHKEAMEALAIVGLADSAKKNARILSHGMSKRLGIAQAFLGNPEVILLDEPTAGLDPASAAGIRDLIDSLRTTATLVISSHDLAEVQKMCDNIAILDCGKLVECSSVADITQADTIQRMTFARPLTNDEIGAAKSVVGVTEVVQDGPSSYRMTIDTQSTGRKPEEITAEIVQKLVTTGAIPRSIEDGVALESKFLEVTKGQMPGPPAGPGQPPG